ncbi:MAG: histidinol dehydrogenase [Chloroflexia bacterium]|nr:histidinol dehydrogenase [Chloroflexia bacterium]
MIARINGLEAGLTRLTRRGDQAEPALPPHFAARIKEVFGQPMTAAEVVSRIIADVRREGDAAVRRYTEAFDGTAPDRFEVPRSAWNAAWNEVGPEIQAALTIAAERIRAFHEKQTRPTWFEPDELGIFGQIVLPLDRIGIYTPGGSAALPSSLLMTAIPARVAGVREVIVSAPPRHNGGVAPIILAAARVAGVNRVFSIGGAQAIAALAFGTESVPHVDKILGPGNVFVATAKQQVYGTVDIDQIAGPTETLLIADDSADIELVAADMLAQSEHGADSSAILVTTSIDLANRIEAELERQVETLSRGDIAWESLATNGAIVIVGNLDEAVSVSNAYAPEHLCLLVQDPWGLVPQVRNAGGIFIGESSPEALGDYTAGPSHVMPTGGTARFSSPVNVSDFQKVISVIAANDRAIDVLGPATVTLANAEGLGGHAAAIERRMRRR